jgi:hypothetical protein
MNFWAIYYAALNAIAFRCRCITVGEFRAKREMLAYYGVPRERRR